MRLEIFCRYASAFQRALVPHLDEGRTEQLHATGTGFVLHLPDNHRVFARRIVLATGIGHFARMPDALGAIRGPALSHSIAVKSLAGFSSGQEVLIIGGGASGVELAGLLSARDVRVTVAIRADRIAFCGPHATGYCGSGPRYPGADRGPDGAPWPA